MRYRLLLGGAGLGIALASGVWWEAATAKPRGGKRPPPEPPVPTVDETPVVSTPEARPASPGLPEHSGLWSATLPLGIAKVPPGLANLSAQGCAGCHPAAWDGWRASAHAMPPPASLHQAALEAKEPRCLGCHLPLASQHAAADNLGWDAVLADEGVTCVACHLRDGHIVGVHADARGPHPGKWSSELQGPEACAACHQLTWPGASAPLYDTVGEWQRSAWAVAGVGCSDCHLRSDPAADRVTHAVDLPAARALSVQLIVPGGAITRGAAPLDVTLTLQNTGAGHAWPSGSPFLGARVTAVLEGPAKKGKGREPWGGPFVQDLRRTLEAAPPWRTVADTRLPAGGSRTWAWSLALPVDAPPGPYTLKLVIHKTRGDLVVGDAVWVREIPLTVR